MPTPAADQPVDAGAVALVEGLGWQVAPDAPALRSPARRRVRAADAAGVGLSAAGCCAQYAEAMRGVAEVDLAVAERASRPQRPCAPW